MICVGDVERDVLEILQKAPGTSGYYTEQKLRTALQECFDYVATKMFDAQTGGWLDDIRYFDTTTGDSVIKLPANMALLKVVRYKVNTAYVPLEYDKQEKDSQVGPSDGYTQQPSRYRLVGDSIYFNPALYEGGANYLQLELTCYPPRFMSKLDSIDSRWNPCFRNYIKYRTASILVSHKRDFTPPWQQFEAEWKEETIKLIDKRVITEGFTRPFGG